MPNVYKPNLIQVKISYDVAPDTGEHPVNVLWVYAQSGAGPYTNAQLQAVCTFFDTYFSAIWTKVGAPAYHYLGSTATDWTSASGGQYSSVGVLTPIAGGTSGSAMNPLQVAVLISWKVALRFKGGHARTYLPYINNSVNATDPREIGTVPQGQVNTAINTFMTNLATAPSPGPYNLAMYKFRRNAAAANIQIINSGSCNLVFATQRRRLRKTAHH